MGTVARSFTGSNLAGQPLAGRYCAGAFLRSWPCFLSYSKLNDAHQPLIASRLAAASGPLPPSFSSPDLGVEAESPELQAQSPSVTTMVRVIFQLQKACVFGQHFFVVGDDPILGSWDPVQAVPLVWSDGHLWSAEMNLPVGKYILFKFILKGSTGDVTWQPGPDRILETWETKNFIVISEDWDNVELQKITEENIFEQTTVPFVLTDIEEGVTQGEEIINLEEDEETISINDDQQVLVPGLISAEGVTQGEEIIILEEDEETIPINDDQQVLVPGFDSAEGVTQGEEIIILEEDEETISINDDQQVLVPGLVSAEGVTQGEEIIILEEDEKTISINDDQQVLVPGFVSAEGVAQGEEIIILEEDEETISINDDQQVLVPGLIFAASSITEEATEGVEIIEFVPHATYVEAIESTLLKEKDELMNESEKSNDPLHISKPDDTNGDFGVSMANQSPEGDLSSEEVPFTSDVFKNNVQWVLKFLLRFILKLMSGIMNMVELAK